jgi:hypothetical protein
MPKEKNKKGGRKKKAGKKGSQLAIRIEESERDAFVALCDRLDTSAAREIRRFMREFVAAHAPAAAVAEPTPGESVPAPATVPAPEKKPRAPRKPRVTSAPEVSAADEAAPPPSRRRKQATKAPGA